jgi:hypothetical protein
VELIGATVARAVKAMDGTCNAIGGGGCPIGSIAIGGCPMPWTVARIVASHGKKSRKERKKEPKKERKEVCYISIYLYISLIIDIHIE